MPAPAKSAKRPLPKWGWIEWFILFQLLSPGLLFVPGLSAVRLYIRIASFLIAPVFWVLIFQFGKHRKGGESFPALPALWGCLIYLCLSMIHPDTNSLLSAVAHVGLYASVMSPAFWVGWDLKSSHQISRIMAILFLCNALSATLGIAQVYQPDRFNPPVIPSFSNELSRSVLTYKTETGEEIIRPCGLTDTPGGAAAAGAMATLIGLCWAMRPIGLLKRLICLGLAFLGVSAIYYTQIRTLLLLLVGCMVALTILFALQGNVRKATTLAGLGGGLLVGALSWVAARVGAPVLDRFATLWKSDPLELYQRSRGGFVTEALGETLWNYPVGAGLGRWGQIYDYFGNKNLPSIWVEVQWPAWIIDGGFPLLLLYVGALALAMYDSVRIALVARDPELKFWAAVVVAANLSVIASTFGNCPFVAASGVQFWLLGSVLHVAYVREREETKRRAMLAGAAAAAAGAGPGGSRRSLVPRPSPAGGGRPA